MTRFRAQAVLTKVPSADPAKPSMVLIHFPAANKGADTIYLGETALPVALRQRLEDGRQHGKSVRAHCVINLAAERHQDLDPTDWETT